MRTRFAPSPTGPLHLGHAYSAMVAHDMARAAGGAFLLRIDDIDQTRCKPMWETLILEDLRWLGMTWDGDIRRQSDHLADYGAALDRLWEMGLLYACTCNRRDMAAAAAAPQEGAAPALGPDGIIYPRTCAPLHGAPAPTGTRPANTTLRLNMSRALDHLPEVLSFRETGSGGPDGSRRIDTATAPLPHTVGDIVLSRRDFLGSYHLSVVVDDAAQSITHVVRGADLFDATAIHVVLQYLLDVPTPIYHHHRLIRDESGRRLAKRDDARALQTYRAEGLGPGDIRAMFAPGPDARTA